MSTTASFASTAKQAEVVEDIANIYTTGVERLAESQKKTLEVAQQQNSAVIDAWRKIAQETPGAPGLFMLDWAAATFGQCAEVQRGAIDLAMQQNQTMTGFAKERAASVSKAAEGVTAMAQETADRAAALQKKAIEFTTAQAKTLIDTFKRQSGVAGTPAEAVATSLQHGLDSLAETQKELLDIAAKASRMPGTPGD